MKAFMETKLLNGTLGYPGYQLLAVENTQGTRSHFIEAENIAHKIVSFFGIFSIYIKTSLFLRIDIKYGYLKSKYLVW